LLIVVFHRTNNMSNDFAESIVGMATALHERDIKESGNTIKFNLYMIMSDNDFKVTARPTFVVSTTNDGRRCRVDIEYEKESIGGKSLGDMTNNIRTCVRSKYEFPAYPLAETSMEEAIKTQFTEFVCGAADTVWEARMEIMDEYSFLCNVEYSYTLSKGERELSSCYFANDITEKFREDFPQQADGDVRMGFAVSPIVDELVAVVWKLVKRQMFLKTVSTREVPSYMEITYLDASSEEEESDESDHEL
jgi:hypothetical protein